MFNLDWHVRTKNLDAYYVKDNHVNQYVIFASFQLQHCQKNCTKFEIQYSKYAISDKFCYNAAPVSK